MQIKTTILNYNNAFRHTKTFRQYVADNGNAVYTVGNNIVTKEEGNRIFIDTIEGSATHDIKNSVVSLTDAEILNKLNESIDPYTVYIEDYKQYKEARRINDQIYSIIEAFKSIM